MLTLNKPEVEEYLSRARSALGVGAYDIALNCTAAAIAADGKNPTAYFLNGQAHLAAHSYAAAEASYKKAISLGFQAAACSFGLGAAQAMGGYYSAALRNFTLALRQPGCSEEMRLTICHQLALLSLQMGDAAAALRYFDKEDEVPVVNPHLTESLVHRVSIHISRNENDQALLCAEQLIRLHPDEFDYHHVYANVLIRYAAAEKLDAARNALEQAHASLRARAVMLGHIAVIIVKLEQRALDQRDFAALRFKIVFNRQRAGARQRHQRRQTKRGQVLFHLHSPLFPIITNARRFSIPKRGFFARHLR